MKKYEEPNKNNVKLGDYLISMDDGSFKRVSITEITKDSAIAEYKFEDDEVRDTHPYKNAIIQKKDGIILVGREIAMDGDIKSLLEVLLKNENKCLNVE